MVALMRHTDAPSGAGDPPGFAVDDCATQRNLSAKGRADPARIGARLRSEGIAVEKNPQFRRGAAAWTQATLCSWDRSKPSRHLGNVVVLKRSKESPYRRRGALSSINGPAAEPFLS